MHQLVEGGEKLLRQNIEHVSVLLAEALQQLNCKRGSTFVDCTLGGAGHAGAILDLIAPEGILVGIDADDEAINAAKNVLRHFSQQTRLIKGNFKDIDRILNQLKVGKIDGFLFDLGVSSIQLDDAQRGFSYQKDGPLDMRMDRQAKLTAAQIINSYSEKELTSLISKYGEEKWASRIAHFIVQERKRRLIKTTSSLVEVIKKAVPASARRLKHPARRVFQALRIEVNQELEALKKGLVDAVGWLKVGGRGVVISYHSLEDAIVKETFRDLAKGCVCPPDFPECRCGRKKAVASLTPKPIRPSKEEVEKNLRARSAKLRAIEKI